jgi:outer membrane protein W
MVGYTWLKNTTTLSTGQTQPMTLNPVSVAISVGYKF